MVGVLLAAAVAPVAVAEELVWRDAERPVAAQLSGWDGAPRLAVSGNELAGGEDLVRWGAAPEGRAVGQNGWLLLVDGSRLAGRVRFVGPREIGMRAGTLEAATLPAELVVGWIEHPPRTGLDRLEREMRAASGADDLVITASGERLAGVLQFDDAGRLPDALQLERRGSTERVRWSRVRAVVLSPALRERARGGARWQIALDDGSWLAASRVSPDGRVTLVSGAAVQLAGGGDWIERVRMVAPGSPPEWLVSAARPLRAVHQPWLPGAEPADPVVGRDAARGGGRLRVAEWVYPFGLAMRSGTQAIYRVPEGAGGFAAELAMLNVAGEGVAGAAVFRVLAGADVRSIREVFRSEVVRGGAAPEPMRVGLDGMRVVVLAVDYGPAGDVGDEAVWLDARWTASP